jgi:transcriptional regulator with XRE-family HTH domain
MNKTSKQNTSALSKLLNEITPSEQAKTDAKMIIAAKIADALKAKGWKHADLLNALGKKNPSVVTKWLSGTHNFTVDTLVELECVLDISLLNIEKNQEKAIASYTFVLDSVVRLNQSNWYMYQFPTGYSNQDVKQDSGYSFFSSVEAQS